MLFVLRTWNEPRVLIVSADVWAEGSKNVPIGHVLLRRLHW
jgi:hypothetical protein